MDVRDKKVEQVWTCRFFLQGLEDRVRHAVFTLGAYVRYVIAHGFLHLVSNGLQQAGFEVGERGREIVTSWHHNVILPRDDLIAHLNKENFPTWKIYFGSILFSDEPDV